MDYNKEQSPCDYSVYYSSVIKIFNEAAEKLHHFWQNLQTALIDLVANNSDFNEFGDEINAPTWIIDSGFTFHGVKDVKLLRNIVPCKTNFDGFSGELYEANYVGEARLSLISSINKTISLNGVLYVPDLAYNVISVSRLTSDFPALMFEFNSRGFLVKNFMKNELMASGKRLGNYYYWHRPKFDVRGLMIATRNVFFRNLSNLLAPVQSSILNFQSLNNLYEDKNRDDLWILDSGSPVHIASNVALLDDCYPLDMKVCWGDLVGRTCTATHVGKAYLGGPNHGIMLSNVQIVEGVKENLISIAALTSDNSCSVKFFSSGFALKSLEDGKLIAMGVKFDNYYCLSHKSFQILGTKDVT